MIPCVSSYWYNGFSSINYFISDYGDHANIKMRRGSPFSKANWHHFKFVLKTDLPSQSLKKLNELMSTTMVVFYLWKSKGILEKGEPNESRSDLI